MSDLGVKESQLSKTYANKPLLQPSISNQEILTWLLLLREHLSDARIDRKRSIREWHKTLGPWGHSKDRDSHWEMGYHWWFWEERGWFVQTFLWWQLSSPEFVGCGNREGKEVIAMVRQGMTTDGWARYQEQCIDDFWMHPYAPATRHADSLDVDKEKEQRLSRFLRSLSKRKKLVFPKMRGL